MSEDQLNRAFIEFKKLADRKKELFDADIEALIVHNDGAALGPWRCANCASTRAAARWP